MELINLYTPRTENVLLCEKMRASEWSAVSCKVSREMTARGFAQFWVNLSQEPL
jgi:hypothetical protein